MKQAGAAMAQIHGNLTIDKVDEAMYASNSYIVIIEFSCHTTSSFI
jgi:hypothetical protein